MKDIFFKKTSKAVRRAEYARGFTLVEMIVALGIFTIALFIATNALLAVVNADRKSRGTRIATDNLNLTLEDISRKIRTGYSYNCGGNPGVADCSTPQSVLAFNDQNNIRTIYKRGVGGGAIVGGVGASGCGAPFVAGQGCILRSDGGAAFVPGTSSEIDITSLNFFVSGSAVWPDTKQPQVIMSMDGSLGTQPLTKISFKIQTSATQRVYDR